MQRRDFEHHSDEEDDMPGIIGTDSDESDDFADEANAGLAGHAPGEGAARLRAARRRGGQPGPDPQERLERIALFDFLRLVAGGHERAAAHTNEELVNSLLRNGVFTSDTVRRAMLTCPRDLFVPARYAPEALADMPIRVEEHGFNISAPHMHASSLEALDIKPGHRVLDVGCGCGIVAAYAAVIAGRSGEVVGLDIRTEAVAMCRSSVERLQHQNLEFGEVAAPLSFERHNVFIPASRHAGRYDAVHVGGAVPASRVGQLLGLLAARGGSLVVPVGQDLRLITKHADGTVKQRIISQVRFSELEVPRDVEVVLAMEQDRIARARRIDVPPSSFAKDLAHLAAPGVTLAPPTQQQQQPPSDAAAAAAESTPGEAAAANGPSSSRIGVSEADAAAAAAAALGPAPGGAGAGASASEVAAGHGGRGPALEPEGACGDGSGVGAHEGGGAAADSNGALKRAKTHEGQDTGSAWPAAGPPPAAAGAAAGSGGTAAPPYLAPYLLHQRLALGAPDCCLAGGGPGPAHTWRLPAHKAVLQARCDLLRAHMGSGMRDSDCAEYRVPETIASRDAMEAFLHYVYSDALPPGGVEAALLPQVLHAGIYYGCHRLVALCEAVLASELMAAAQDGAADVVAAAAESAAPLLQLADDSGLEQLRAVALQFILDRYPLVSATDNYQALPRPLVDSVTATAIERHARLLEELREMGAREDLLAP